MNCEHSWTEKTFPGLETRWCTRCNDTTEVELANLRAEVERLREAARQVHALAHKAIAVDWRIGLTKETLTKIHNITKGMVE